MRDRARFEVMRFRIFFDAGFSGAESLAPLNSPLSFCAAGRFFHFLPRVFRCSVTSKIGASNRVAGLC
jgi:hypothetical protein